MTLEVVLEAIMPFQTWKVIIKGSGSFLESAAIDIIIKYVTLKRYLY